MSNELKGGDNAQTLSTDINVITAEINAYQRVAGEAIFEIGKRLKHVRESIFKEDGHLSGKWAKWCEDINFNITTAKRFIRVYEELGSSRDTWHGLSMRVLYEISTISPAKRGQAHEIPTKGIAKTVDEMTVRELQEVKRELKKTQEQRDAEQRERERLEIENSELAEREPEVRTEYVEKEVVKTEVIDNTPDDYDEVKQRLESYTDKFGDLSNYDDNVTATHRQDMIVAVMSMSQGVREFIKRYEYMKQYKGVIDNLDEQSIAQYNEAVTALKGMAESFEYAKEHNIVIDAEYSEII